MATYDFGYIADREMRQRRRALYTGLALLALGLGIFGMVLWLTLG